MSRFSYIDYRIIEIYEKLVRFIKSGEMEQWCYHEFGKGIEIYRIQEEIIDFSVDIMKGTENPETTLYFKDMIEKIEEWTKNITNAVCIPISE